MKSDFQSSTAVGEAAIGPIDHAFLARYTMGNQPLEREVLHLFAEQAPQVLGELEAATEPHAWYVAAHTLKGSARAVGAWRVAEFAEQAEAVHDDPSARIATLDRLRRALREAVAYIDGLD